jgi:hypothetical protein
MIDNIFKTLDPYLRGVKKADNYCVVEVNLKPSWLIPQHPSIENQNKPTKINGITYYMFYSDKLGFDGIIEWLKNDVVEMNIELEQKEDLLKSKVEQLKEIFENSSLEELQKMDFGTSKELRNPLKLGNKINKEEKTVENKIDTEDEKTVEA